MYSANHYSGPDFGPGQFQGQMIPASDMGPQVIQFNFFGQDSQFPKLMSGLNFTNESDSDIDSDYNCGASLDKDPQGYPFRCTLNANKFERDFNNNCPDDGADHLKVRREFVTHKNPRKLYNNNDMHQKVSDTRGSRLDFQSQNYLNPGTDWKDQNISSGFLRRSVEKSFNGPYYWQESEMMNACFPDAGSRQDEPVHYNGERLEPNERHRLNKLHERNVSHLQPSHTSNIFCGGNLTNFTLDNTKKSHNHTGSVDVMNVVVDRDKLAKPGIARSYETSEPATTQPDDKKPAVAKYDLTNCRYCRVAKQPYDHPLYNDLREVVCAKLSQYKCPFCNATGKQAHTLKYCKENPILRGELAAIKKLGKGKAPEEHRDEAFRLKKRKLKCRYCRKLGRDFDHLFKDAEGVTCPELFKVVCELCGATGKNAHSKEYCKQDKNENQPDAYVAVSTPGIHAPQACNSAEPSAGGTATADVPTSTEQVLIPDKLTDYLSSRRSFENLHNSSTVLSSTLCVSEDDQSPGVTEGIVKGSSRLDALKSVSEVRGYFDSMARVKSGSNLMMDVFEVAGVKTGISDETVEKIPALVMAVEKNPAMNEAVEKNPAMNEAVEKNPAMNEAVEKNPAMNEAVEKNPAMNEAVEKNSAMNEAVEKNPAMNEAVEKNPALNEAVEKNPALNEAVEENPALNEAVEENPSLNEAVEENPALEDIE